MKRGTLSTSVMALQLLVAAVLSLLVVGAPSLAAASPTASAADGHLALAAKMSSGQRPIPKRPHSVIGGLIAGPLLYNDGQIQTAPKVYVDFWDWTSDPSGEAPYVTKFLSSIGGTPWAQTLGQYGASDTPVLAGTWSDPTPIPANPSDSQIQAEAVAAAQHFGLSLSVNDQIVVATPTGHGAPVFDAGDCAYHGVLAADAPITYTNLPYLTDAGNGCGEDSVNGSSGLLDGVSIVEGHEMAESITDPAPWSGWADASGYEIGDKCAWTGLGDVTTSNGTYAVQPLWSNLDNGCDLTSTAPSITSVSFNGSATSPTVTVNGSGFGTAPRGGNSGGSVSCFAGTGSGNDYSSNSLFLMDDTARWFAGLSGDCVGIANVISFTPAKIVFGFGSFYNTHGWVLSAGHTFTLSVNGASATAVVQYAKITSVSFTGTPTDPTVTVKGTGFGTSPASAAVAPGGGGTGADFLLEELYLVDSTRGWYAGGVTNWVGIKVLVYTPTKVVYQFGSYYNAGGTNWILKTGNDYGVRVAGATLSGVVEYS